MTYQEVLDYLFNQFPQYQKIGGKAFKPGLDNIVKVCDHLGNPQRDLKIIHVAGTNGKGSTCSMMASVLTEAGYKVGLFTSPHIADFSERIRINGIPISQENVISFVEKNKSFFDNFGASFFEWSTALAFHYFKEQKVDFAIIETGLGGRLDATNIVSPILSIITNISIDHTQYLGNTIEEIAGEKAGIVKEGVPVVTTCSNPPEVLAVLKKYAERMSSKLIVASVNENYESDLTGGYQRLNKGVVVAALELLEQEGIIKISLDNLKRGFLSVSKNAGLRGRWELLQTAPKVVADIGHNYEGVKEVVAQLGSERFEKLHIVWGMVADKEIEKVVSLLPREAKYYLSSPNVSRGLKVEELASFFKDFNKVKNYASTSEAYADAIRCSESDDLILVGGSTFIVAEIISNFF